MTGCSTSAAAPGSCLGGRRPIDYCGIDISQSYIDEAVKRYGPRGRFLIRSATNDVSDLGRFDVAITLGVLHHLDDGQVAIALASVRRALNPGGRFVALGSLSTLRIKAGLPNGSLTGIAATMSGNDWLIMRSQGNTSMTLELPFTII